MTDHIATFERMLESRYWADPDEQAAITAAIALMRGRSWQDIATAPRDGTRFVIWSDAAKDYVIVRFSGEHFTDDHANPWVCWRLWSYLPTPPKDTADEQ